MGYRVVLGSVKIETDTIDELMVLLSRLQRYNPKSSDAGRHRKTLQEFVESLPTRTRQFLELLAGSPNGIERSSAARSLGLGIQEVSRLVAGLSRRVRDAGYRLDDVMVSRRVRWPGGRTYWYTPSDALLEWACSSRVRAGVL
jgi:hypothetical protein